MIMADKSSEPRYTIIIQWSEEDQCYVASLPEWAALAYASPHGRTYEEAAKSAREVLALLMEDEPDRATVLPEPKMFHYPGADIVNLPDGRASVAASSRQMRQTA